MRRIVLALMSTVAAVVLLFGYRTSTPHPTGTATPTVAAAGTGGGTAGTGGTTPAAPSTPSTTSPAGSSTVTGSVAQTRWGPVQVQLTVSSGKITAVTVLQQPDGNGRDAEITDAALPVLEQETLQAQSAHTDSVSGATVTSDGYVTSLQSALDQAGL